MNDDSEKPVETPEWLKSIPDNVDEQTKLYMRAQLVIQSAFYTFGNTDQKSGSKTLTRHDLESAIAFAQAMLLTTDNGLETKRDMRRAGDNIGRYIADVANAIRAANDTNPTTLLAMLNLQMSKPN